MTYTAHTILGIRLDCHDLYYTKDVDGCIHKHNSNFCPECGAPVFSLERLPIDGFDEAGDTLAGFEIHYTYEDLPVVVGEELGEAREGDSLTTVSNIPDSKHVETVKTKLREVLEPAGLWDEEKFGLWTVLRIG